MEREVTLTIRDVIQDAANRLKKAGVDGANQDAWLLMSHVRQRDRATLLAHAREDLDADDLRAFQALVCRRIRREPLAQIVGMKEFWSLEFRITTDVLCPRPDSECLIEASVAEAGDRGLENETARLLDLGTGSGCLLLALLSELPSAEGIGVDISRSALSVARSNAEKLGFAERARWLCGDWAKAFDSRFDIVLCNPPYIARGAASELAPEILQFEPEKALFAGEDGLDAYRSLACDLRRLLTANGFACIEVGFDQAEAVTVLMECHGLRSISRRLDLAGIDRCLIVDRA